MKRELFFLQDKVVLTAGGVDDIRVAYTRVYAHYRTRIIISNRGPGKIRGRLDEWKRKRIRTDSYCGDIANEGLLESMVKEIAAIYGRIDIALNNTAATDRKPMLEFITAQWRGVINISLNGAYCFLREVGRVICGQDHGRIVQILSTGVYRFGVDFSAYRTSKAGVSALVKCLAVEQVPYNIQVNGIVPTATEAGFTRDYYREYPGRMEATTQSHLYRRLGQPEDYTRTAVYLVSEAAGFVSDEAIIIDSGKTVKRRDVYWG